MGLGEADEFGDHVLPADRRPRAIELGNLAQVVIGERLTHLRLGPEIERQNRSEELYGVRAPLTRVTQSVGVVAAKSPPAVGAHPGSGVLGRLTGHRRAPALRSGHFSNTRMRLMIAARKVCARPQG